MARIICRWNVPESIQDDLARASAAAETSKSELVNRALAAALADFPSVVAYQIAKPGIMLSKSRPAGYSVEPSLIEGIKGLSTKLTTANDTMVRLALDYYLNHTLKEGITDK